jgi:hypothetical protein
LRPKSLEIDGRSISDWRAKSFFDVGSGEPARSLLMRLVGLRAQHPTTQPMKPVGESNFCPADTTAASISQNTSEVGMRIGYCS